VLGHLVEMVNACNADAQAAEGGGGGGDSDARAITARIYLDALPCMAGAVECIEGGIFSSLQPANIRLRRAVTTASQRACKDDPRYPLLFDPQTAGGLLATIPEGEVDACLRELRGMGYPEACVLGEVILESGQDEMDRGVEVVVAGEPGGGGGGGGEEEEEEEEEEGGGGGGDGGDVNGGSGKMRRRRRKKKK
jgi:hypothetical protein